MLSVTFTRTGEVALELSDTDPADVGVATTMNKVDPSRVKDKGHLRVAIYQFLRAVAFSRSPVSRLRPDCPLQVAVVKGCIKMQTALHNMPDHLLDLGPFRSISTLALSMPFEEGTAMFIGTTGDMIVRNPRLHSTVLLWRQ